jgi:hypothetical protein
MAAFARSWRREWARAALGVAGAFKQKHPTRYPEGEVRILRPKSTQNR